MGKYEKVLEEGRGPRVPRSMGSKVQWSQGPRYLKLTFKYKLDSKEGPSCIMFIFNIISLKELVGMFVWSRSQQDLQYANWDTGEQSSYEERDCVFKEFDFLPGSRGWSVYNCDSQTNANGWPIHALCQTTPASHA